MVRNNHNSLWLAIASGILLLISGSNGYDVWKAIGSVVTSLFGNSIPINLVLMILLIIASFGGISVMIGGYLLYKKRIITGRLMIMLGSGAGILYLIIKIVLILFTEEKFDLFSSLTSIGIVLGIAAQITAKK